MIIMPPTRISRPQTEIWLPRQNLQMAGKLRMRVWRPDMELHRCVSDTGWMPNKILDNGRNNMATQSSWLGWCMVGTNNTAPLATHTKLLGKVAETNTLVDSNRGQEGSAPYFGWYDTTHRFGVGDGQGGENISEASIGWASGSGDVAISRALVIDPDTQVTTSVTPLADELLDVSWRFEYYPPLVDVEDSITLNGVNYDTVCRAASVTGSAWSDHIGQLIEDDCSSTSDYKAWDGSLGAITSTPGGSGANLSNINEVYTEGYQNNSYEVVIVASVGPTAWNLGSHMRCLTALTKAGQYQMSFDSNPGNNPVPKTTDETMIMKWILGWTEKV